MTKQYASNFEADLAKESHQMTDTPKDTRALLSTLWIFVLLNMLFRDIHEIPTVEFLDQALVGKVNGVEVTDELLLLGGFLIEFFLVMVPLSRVLPYALNRWTNIVVGVLAMALTVSSNTAPDLDDAFFAFVELVALAFIVSLAWRWKATERVSEIPPNAAGLPDNTLTSA